MKKLMLFQTLFLLGILLTACSKTQTPNGDFANWNAWTISWQASNTFSDVTVKIDDQQKTYLPEQKNDVFLAVSAVMLNSSQSTQEMRFWQKDVYVIDPKNQNVYYLMGVARKDVILMAPPYLLIDKTRFSTEKWDDGRFVMVAYQDKPQSWFIQATPNSLLYIDLLFTLPTDFDKIDLHFGNGVIVHID